MKYESTGRPTEILKSHSLKVTQQRLAVLSCFVTSYYSFSYHDLNLLANDIDRVSLYRILQLYTELGIIFKLADDNGNPIYVFNHYINATDELLTLLKCDSCKEISALPNPPVEYLSLLKNYHVVNPHFLFKGICDNCK